MRFNAGGKKRKNPWKDHWYTPGSVLAIVEEVLGGIALDPASSPTNPTRALTFFTPEEDGLSRPWEDGFFCNPPFSNKEAWIKKAVIESRNHCDGILLVPSACQANKGSKDFVAMAAAVAHLGRVRFVPSPELINFRKEEGLDPSPIHPQDDMILLFFGRLSLRFSAVLGDKGYPVYYPVKTSQHLRAVA